QSFISRSSAVLDTFNFLGSGKEWYGEEFANSPGKFLSRTFNFPVPNRIVSQPVSVNARFAGRSVGGNSRFVITANGQNFLQLDVPATTSLPSDPFAKTVSGSASGVIGSNDVSLKVDFTPGSFNAQGWLDYFEVFATANLSLNGVRQLQFRDWNSIGAGNIGQFKIQNASSGIKVWDVTFPSDPLLMQISLAGSELNFNNDCSSLHEYVAFNADSAFVPESIGKINNQNLHNPAIVDMLIIASEMTLSEANHLAQHHLQKDNLKSLVVTANQVFNEFSSGTPDPTAMRDFAKMFYDRANGDSTRRPKYLLLFGDASFDYKNRLSSNTNLVPAYESLNSLDPLSTYTSDDFFGFLDDGDDINSSSHLNLLDIGIGRITAKDAKEAKNYVDKVIAYTSPQSLGSWRNNLTFIADDEDFNLHFHDAEVITATAKNANPVFIQDKIYLDAFQQVGGAGGARYPDANRASDEDIYNGTLLYNYTGHGGFRRLAEEVILDQDIINKFNNPFRLPLFLTATCDFAPYDDPRNNSIGENVLLREKTGAIALMTTTRLVFAFSNKVMNQNYLQIALQRKSDSTYRTLGEAVKEAKNFTYQNFGDIVNNRKFTLLGDPALQLAFPKNKIVTTSINNKPIATVDTVKALQQVSVAGQVADAQGNLLSDFNGTVYVSVFDKAQNLTTRGNDPDSYAETFSVQKNLIYKGKVKAQNGEFETRFIVPKDINYQFGPGNIVYYAENGTADGNGNFTGFIVGGSDSGSSDNVGPEIKAYLNDEKFVNGSITNNRPLLIVKLHDTSGINILGTGIGHDLVATLDNDQKNSFILNRSYESELDNFRRGTVRYQLPEISEGTHVLKIKAWDVANNSNEIQLEFEVRKSEDLVLERVLNYPNPFTTRTSFWFQHNHPFEALQVRVQVFTVTGKLVKTIARNIVTEGNLVTDLEWDGKDDFGDKLGRGV
ncbi:MAG TPA: type IX secretion system sortase PorU, partial [Chitinophagaceae bacterium]|nr:type IX secretion system sortase PorU [Chitinophagaceae bacterium]